MINQNEEYQRFIKRAKEIIASFPNIRTVGFGDVMLDIWWRSNVERPNPECSKGYDLLNPRKSQSAGGAANVAVNIGALGGKCDLVGVVGEDDNGAVLEDLMLKEKNIFFAAVRDVARPTTSKTRFYSEKGIARISIESLADVDVAIAEKCIEAIKSSEERSAGLWVEDYGKGTIQKETVDYLVELVHSHPKMPVVFDPKIGHGTFYRAGMCSVFKPNWSEACDLLKLDPKTADRTEVVKKLSEKFDCDVLVTLGGDGSIVYERDTGKTTVIPTRSAKDRDVTGAGDTIVGTLTPALATGMSLVEATILANCAAGVVVRKEGTASASPQELISELERNETQIVIEQLIRDGCLMFAQG